MMKLVTMLADGVSIDIRIPPPMLLPSPARFSAGFVARRVAGRIAQSRPTGIPASVAWEVVTRRPTSQ